MKKFFFSLLAIAAIAACAKTEDVYTPDNSEIKIAPVTSLATKTVYNAIDGTAYPTAEEFVVNAYWDGLNGEKDVKYLTDVVFENKGQGQYWGGKAATYYWPKNGSLRFAAYSPETVPGVSHDVTTDKYTVEYTQSSKTAKTIDFLIAPITEPYTAQTATENVSVVFEHALAWITVKVKAANPEAAAAYTLHDVIIEDAYTTATLTAEMGDGIQYGEWSETKTGAADYAVVTGANKALTTEAVIVEDTKNGTVVIPQVPTTLSVYFTQNEMEGTPSLKKQHVNVPLELDDESNNRWEPGKHYIYTVIFDVDEILINPSVADWEDIVVEDKDVDDAGQIATVANETELKAALAAEVAEIEVTDVIALTSELKVNYSVAFVGGGFTGCPIVVTGAQVSFEDVEFANGNDGKTAVYVRNGNTHMTFQNCTFDAYEYEAIQYTSEDALWVCVDGCTFNAAAHRDLHLQVKNVSKAEVKITNNVFNDTDADSYVTVYGFEHERMILDKNKTQENANTVNVWISDAFNANNLTLRGFVKPDATVPAALAASTILANDVTVETLDLGEYDLDGAGNAVIMKKGTANYFVTSSKGYISNVDLVGYGELVPGTDKSIRGLMLKPEGDVVLYNVNITGFGYALNTLAGNTGTLTVENSTLEGWTSISGFTAAKFINTNFTRGTYFDGMYGYTDPSVVNIYNGLLKPYGAIELVGCTFDKNFCLDFTAGGSLKLTNCNVKGVQLTEANYQDYLIIEGVPTGKITF